MSIFKNRAMQVKFVKTDANDNATTDSNAVNVDPEQIAQIATEYTLKTIAGIGAVIAGKIILTAACAIAVNALDNRPK